MVSRPFLFGDIPSFRSPEDDDFPLWECDPLVDSRSGPVEHGSIDATPAEDDDCSPGMMKSVVDVEINEIDRCAGECERCNAAMVPSTMS